jgi:hypothetical protein
MRPRFSPDNTKCKSEIQMSHFRIIELLQQFRGFQRFGGIFGSVSGGLSLEWTDQNVNLNGNLYLNFRDGPLGRAPVRCRGIAWEDRC